MGRRRVPSTATSIQSLLSDRFRQATKFRGLSLPDHHTGRLKLMPMGGAFLDFINDIHSDLAGSYDRREAATIDGAGFDVMSLDNLAALCPLHQKTR